MATTNQCLNLNSQNAVFIDRANSMEIRTRGQNQKFQICNNMGRGNKNVHSFSYHTRFISFSPQRVVKICFYFTCDRTC